MNQCSKIIKFNIMESSQCTTAALDKQPYYHIRKNTYMNSV